MKSKKSFSIGTGLVFLFLFTNVAFNQNSVLSEGTWHKLAVTESGVHRIGYNDLLDYGIDPATINPKFIRICGNGGNMLPEVNNAFRYEDLVENAILVSGEEDNVFDPGDFILFFGEEPVAWTLTEPGGFFKHRLNPYTEKTCYFLNFDTGPGKRIEAADPVSGSLTHIRSTYNARQYHELEEVNLIRSGRRWFGEFFDNQLTYTWTFNLPHLAISAPAIIDVALAARSSEASHLNVKVNGNQAKLVEVLPVSWNTAQHARFRQDTTSFLPLSNQLFFELEYIKPNDSAIAWLDYFTLNFTDSLFLQGDQLLFRDVSSVGSGNITLFNIAGANAQTRLWDVTDAMNIKSISGNLAGDMLDFKANTDSLKEFIVFNPAGFYNAVYLGPVPNQNLRGGNPVDYIIVAHEDFKDQADQLADFHENWSGLTTQVVTPAQIYNEFSSGIQDVTAIRDYVKLMFDKSAGEQPKYLLLFGNASFDYKDFTTANTNFVPAWQSPESLNLVSSMCSDDYYGWLDDGEGVTGFMDIGIGRLPVTNTAEAVAVVNKIIHYATHPGTFGNWKNEVCYTADDGDINLHLMQAEEMAAMATDRYNVTKNYFDFFTLVQTPDGPRYPEAKSMISTKVEEGVILINYTGHGSASGWAAEKVLEHDDIESWTNQNRLPVMIAATGDFARFDDPEIISAGVRSVLKPDGGVIGLFSPTRVTFAGSNFTINEKLTSCFYDSVLQNMTLGSLMHHAKEMQNMTHRVWSLLGDPALKVALPVHAVLTDSINGVHISAMSDTLSPGQTITIAGHIQNSAGNVLTDFNGTLLVKVFERPYQRSTLGNVPASTIVSVDLQDSVMLALENVVVNGSFAFSFTLPLDLAEDYGNIKLSYYAFDSNEDASGSYNQITVGGQVSSTMEFMADRHTFQLFPTVTTDHLYVSLSGRAAVVDLHLFDITGKHSFHERITGMTAGQPYRVDMPQLKPGLYLATIQSENTIQTIKVVIR